MISLTPRATVTHWSAAYAGLPWVQDAEGPEAFNCWGLVRHVQAKHFGRDMGHIKIGADVSQWRSVRDVVQRSGWHRVTDTPREGDILLMLDSKAGPHVGVAINAPTLRLLHSLQGRGVQIDRLDRLGVLGLGHLQCWRHE